LNRADCDDCQLGNFFFVTLDPSTNHPLPLSAGRDVLTEPFSEEEEENDVDLDLSFISSNRDARVANRREVFLNTGLYLLFGGIIIGWISGLQGEKVSRDDDNFFVTLFQGVLCLFLLEMGMTASRKLKDLKSGGPGFITFALIAPNLFATIGIVVLHIGLNVFV
jgi:hypothetical protein